MHYWAPHSQPALAARQTDDQLALNALREKFRSWRRMGRSFSIARSSSATRRSTIKGEPLFSPVEGLYKSVWQGKHCDGCHQWNETRLCEQAKNFAANDVSVLRLQHPLGTRFKVALARWAQGGCQ